MIKPVLVVLSRYPKLFKRFKDGLAIHEPGVSRLLVRDGNMITDVPHNWAVIEGDQPFIYARNVNMAWNYVNEADVILCGDDVIVEGPFVEALRETAYADQWVGVSCAQLHGQSPFVCGYFKRTVINKVGPLDEQFTGYGYEDNDWFRRMESPDVDLYTRPVEIPVSHVGGTSYYIKAEETGESVQDSCDRNRLLYNRKWNDGKK